MHELGFNVTTGMNLPLALQFAVMLPWSIQDGQRFFKMTEAYVRGNTIKYISVPEEVSSRVVLAHSTHAC